MFSFPFVTSFFALVVLLLGGGVVYKVWGEKIRGFILTKVGRKETGQYARVRGDDVESRFVE